jgi:DNA invertase Pin-like site-specific DNA recombinase
MVHRVPFLVAELGADVDPFVLHLFAALAEKERTDWNPNTRRARRGKGAQGRFKTGPPRRPRTSQSGTGKPPMPARLR